MHDHSHEITLGISFLLGALHALEPGHGKTAMLVYLAGGKRTVWHPIVMGLSTALTHSVSLIAIASAVHLAHHLATGDHHHEEQVSAGLQWASAVLVLGVGVWMLVQARRGKSVRCCGHDHGADHSHSHVDGDHAVGDCSSHTTSEPDPRRTSYSTTALLGIAVGLLPCPSALAAYFTGLSAGNPGSAYLIIGLFALGIATSLTVVGVLLQRFGQRLNFGTGRLAAVPWPLVRAALILGIGAFYTLRLTVA